MGLLANPCVTLMRRSNQVDKLKGAMTQKGSSLLQEARHLTLQTLAACQFKRLDNKEVRHRVDLRLLHSLKRPPS